MVDRDSPIGILFFHDRPIKIDADDGALVFRADGRRKIHMPVSGVGLEAPRHTRLMAAIAARYSNPFAQNEILEWFRKQVSDG